MIITRRQFVEGGVATAALSAVMSAPALSAEAAPTAIPHMPAPPLPATVPAQPRVMVDPRVNPFLVARARAAFDRHRTRVRQTGIVGISDFAKASGEHRFYLLDTFTGQVTTHLVSHGRGSDPSHTGFLQRFSNQPGSEASSEGGYLVGPYYHGKYGRSMRLIGLDHTNNNAEERAIVVHTAWYAEPDVVRQHGRLGRSEGCFAFPSASHQEVMARLGPGSFLYADRA